MNTKLSYKSSLAVMFFAVAALCGGWQTTRAQQAPLAFGDVLLELQTDSSSATLARNNERITRTVLESGVNFPLTNGIQRELRNAGASNKLIDAIRNASRGNSTAAAHLESGFGYFNRGLFDKAISEYNRAIEADPNFAYAYNGRGVAHRAKGNYDQAISDFDRAIELDPKLVFSYNNRGVVYGYRKQHDLAIADFTKAIELHPKNLKAYDNRGVAYYSKGDYERAAADYRKALEIDPNYAQAKKNLKAVLKEKGN